VGAVRTVFRVAVHTGRPGRPRLVLPETVLLAQVVKTGCRSIMLATHVDMDTQRC